MEFQDGKMKEIYSKVKEAEKLADKHQYKLLQEEYAELFARHLEMQNFSRKSPEYYRINYRLKKVREEMEKYEKDNDTMDQLAMIGITQDAGGLYKMAMTNKNPYLGKLVWIPIGRDKYKAVVMREDGSRVYVRTPQGNGGWFQKHEVELIKDNEVTDSDPTLDEYKFEDPKEIEKAIKEVEKSDHPNMQYLGALKRALELAKQERSIKDDDATENGAIEQYGQNKETEKMEPQKEPIQAQDEKLPEGVKKDAEGYYYYKGKGPYTTIEKALAGGQSSVIKNDSEAKQVQDSFDMLKLMGII